MVSIYAQKEKTNYYLGVLADGYPSRLVANEFRAANGQLLDIKEKVILFGINKKTKVTTFLQRLPFLKEIYVEAVDLGKDNPLKNNPLARRFLALKSKDKNKKNNTQSKSPASMRGSASETPSGSMKAIDTLIRKKAKAIRGK
ncbi:MAG: hypothetical protein GY765_22325 [bacterium]|nr:hypothetical protein [bacterium]